MCPLLRTGKQVIELSVFGKPSTLVYEGYNLPRQKWLVETLQQILAVPVETTKVMTR